VTSEDGPPPQAATVRAEIRPQTPILPLAGSGPPAAPATTLLADAFGPENSPRERPWRPGSGSLRTTFAVGNPYSLQKSDLVQRIIGIYTLVFEVDEWEKANGAITHSRLIESLLAGKYNVLVAKMAANKTPDLTELEDAEANAEEPGEEASSM